MIAQNGLFLHLFNGFYTTMWLAQIWHKKENRTHFENLVDFLILYAWKGCRDHLFLKANTLGKIAKGKKTENCAFFGSPLKILFVIAYFDGLHTKFTDFSFISVFLVKRFLHTYSWFFFREMATFTVRLSQFRNFIFCNLENGCDYWV